MKIVLATYGSRGDVQPMLAFCLALKSAGHDVLLVGPPEKAGWAKKLGCPYMPFGLDVTSFIDSQASAVNFRCSMEFVFLVRQSLKLQLKKLPVFFRDADLIVGSSLMLGASTIADVLNIPYRYVVFSPHLFPSADHPFPVIKTQTLHPKLNAYSWKAASLLDKLNFTWTINRFRQGAGLDPINDAWDHMLGKYPIVACDKAVAGIPLDVGRQALQTGYLHLNFPGSIPLELEQFLSDGDKPVYAGFGSMPPRDQKKIMPLFIKATQMMGKRIVIAAFWENQDTGQFGKDVCFIKQVPHQKLFPKTDIIIHHGGAGTTATAALSGAPQIIVPHILDQYYHGQKIYMSGLGPKPIWRSKLTVKTLTAALNQVVSQPQMKQNAQKLKESIDPQESLRRAVQAIEMTQ